METRPDAKPWDKAPSPTNSPEDRAVRHVNAIMYNIPEVRNDMKKEGRKEQISPHALPIKDHIEELANIRTLLKNMDAQISVKKLQKSLEKFLQEPTDKHLKVITRETFNLGHQLNIAACHIASHVEEMREATELLAAAVKRNEQHTILHQRNMLYILMNNLLTNKDSDFYQNIQQLHQNFLMFRTIEEPSQQDVAEWQKALSEFPSVT